MQNADQSVIYLTPSGLKKIQGEYDKLVKVKRPEVLVKLDQARSLGDLSENAAYQQVRRQQAFLEGHIRELEGILKKAKAVQKSTSDKVELGSRVELKVDDRIENYLIVSEAEADSALGKISTASPLGKKLLGKRAGETIEIEVPAGRVVYIIVGIE